MSEHQLPPQGNPDKDMDMKYLMEKRDRAIERLAEVVKEGTNKEREAELFKTIMNYNKMLDILIQ